MLSVFTALGIVCLEVLNPREGIFPPEATARVSLNFELGQPPCSFALLGCGLSPRWGVFWGEVALFHRGRCWGRDSALRLQQPHLLASVGMSDSILKRGLGDNHSHHYSPLLAQLGCLSLVWKFHPNWEWLPQNSGSLLFLRIIIDNQWTNYTSHVVAGPKLWPILIISFFVATILWFNNFPARSCSFTYLRVSFPGASSSAHAHLHPMSVYFPGAWASTPPFPLASEGHWRPCDKYTNQR